MSKSKKTIDQMSKYEITQATISAIKKDQRSLFQQYWLHLINEQPDLRSSSLVPYFCFDFLANQCFQSWRDHGGTLSPDDLNSFLTPKRVKEHLSSLLSNSKSMDSSFQKLFTYLNNSHPDLFKHYFLQTLTPLFLNHQHSSVFFKQFVEFFKHQTCSIPTDFLIQNISNTLNDPSLTLNPSLSEALSFFENQHLSSLSSHTPFLDKRNQRL